MLALPEESLERASRHEWTMLELFDQFVRTVPSGEMGAKCKRLRSGANLELFAYVQSLCENCALTSVISATTVARRNIIFDALLALDDIAEAYGEAKLLVPQGRNPLIPTNLRSLVFVKTEIGKQHRWMYDRYVLRVLLEQPGFGESHVLPRDRSAIPDFLLDGLDHNTDSSP